MQTIKSASVVILLAAMFYGVYTVVNAPPPRVPKEVAESSSDFSPPLRVEEGDGVDSPAPDRMASPGGSADLPAADSPVPPGALSRPSAFPPGGSFRGDDRSGLNATGDPPAPPPPALRELPLRPVPAPALTSNSGPGGSQAAPYPADPSADPAADQLANQEPNPAASGTDDRSFAPSSQPPSDSTALAPSPVSGSPSNFIPPPTTRESVDEAADSELSPVDRDAGTPNRVAPAGGAAVALGASAAASAESPVGVVPSAANSTANSTDNPTDLPRDLAAPSSYADGVRYDAKDAVFARGWRDAQHDLAQGHFRQALLTLSQVYEDPRLTADDRAKLLETLDPLAGDVIYSTRHLLEPAYEIHRGDTLESVASEFDVPWQLLQNINGVKNPNFLVPGEKLKVVRGPFRAEVNLERSELTLFLNKYYAGRFPISVGADPAPAAGEFEVKSKQPGRTYFAADGRNIPSGHPENPFGRVWLDLGKNVAIHGSAEKADAAANAGCISLSPRDAQDVFAILSEGSRVTIRR